MMAVIKKIVFSISLLMICVVSACANMDANREGGNGNPVGADAPEYRWTTFAGLGERGFRDGQGREALFNGLGGIAVDSEGNIFVAERGNNCIRKITPDGDVTLFAGTPGQSVRVINDGPLDVATFHSPRGIAIDEDDNIYITEVGHGVIRKITKDGTVMTLAGKPGELGHADGTAANARFYWPEGIAVDSAGNVYVSDRGNHTIRMITPDGEVTTLAGVAGERGYVDAKKAEARFNAPFGICIAPDGIIYVAEPMHRTIRKIDQDGNVSTFFESKRGDDVYVGHWTMVMDHAGNLITTQGIGQTISRVSPEGKIEIIAGQYMFRIQDRIHVARVGRDGVGTRARFFSPYGIAMNDEGIIYITDTEENLIRKGEPVR